jgi:hypothetical protein
VVKWLLPLLVPLVACGTSSPGSSQSSDGGPASDTSDSGGQLAPDAATDAAGDASACVSFVETNPCFQCMEQNCCASLRPCVADTDVCWSGLRQYLACKQMHLYACWIEFAGSDDPVTTPAATCAEAHCKALCVD